jgi:putative transposase
MQSKRNRHSIRLKGYDYSLAGAYFVTIVTQGRGCLLGKISEQSVYLYNAGQMVDHWWNELTIKFPNVELDEYVIMPNHFHGILLIKEVDGVNPLDQKEGARVGAALPEIVQWFKTMTTNAYIRGVKQEGWTPFAGRFWQRNYFERIIRDEEEFLSKREYITGNPFRWEMDEENPSAKKSHL